MTAVWLNDVKVYKGLLTLFSMCSHTEKSIKKKSTNFDNRSQAQGLKFIYITTEELKAIVLILHLRS